LKSNALAALSFAIVANSRFFRGRVREILLANWKRAVGS
jgi:hypothetical protein